MHFFSSTKDNGSSDSSTTARRGGEKKKRVTWAPDVVDNDAKYGSLRSPVTIESSELVNDKMVYKITIRLRDCKWNVYRRYSQFEQFHSQLLEESVLDPEEYPSLPKKRWFELNRWTQRHDEEYTKERRGELQKYLQALFKINKKILVHKSKALQSFLEFDQLIAIMNRRREKMEDENDNSESELDHYEEKDDNESDQQKEEKKSVCGEYTDDAYIITTEPRDNRSDSITIPMTTNEPPDETSQRKRSQSSESHKKTPNEGSINISEELKDFVRALIL